MIASRFSAPRWSAATMVCLALTAASSFLATTPARGATRTTAPPAPAMQGAITVGATTWSVLEMGNSSGTFNHFWQLFVLRPETGKWKLATPPGVATNGGLIVAPTSSGDELLTGFGTSQDLAFSPLALTTDAGSRWTPGGLPNALVKAPSALALGNARMALALVGSPSRVLTRSGSLTSWRTLVSARELDATAGSACGITTLTAVALDTSAHPLIGATCSKAGVVGLFDVLNGAWHHATPFVPVGLRSYSFEPLRLSATSALFAASKETTTELVAAWAPQKGGWSLSSPMPLDHGDRLIATGSTGSDEQFVVLSTRAGIWAGMISRTDRSWRTIAVPSGTGSIAITSNGRLEALVASGSRFTAWQQMSNGEGNWTKVQSIVVPIAYGSSS